jgi:hypothetical protein
MAERSIIEVSSKEPRNPITIRMLTTAREATKAGNSIEAANVFFNHTFSQHAVEAAYDAFNEYASTERPVEMPEKGSRIPSYYFVIAAVVRECADILTMDVEIAKAGFAEDMLACIPKEIIIASDEYARILIHEISSVPPNYDGAIMFLDKMDPQKANVIVEVAEQQVQEIERELRQGTHNQSTIYDNRTILNWSAFLLAWRERVEQETKLANFNESDDSDLEELPTIH